MMVLATASYVQIGGWAMLQALWQTPLIALGLWAALRFVPATRPTVGYRLCVWALLLAAACPAVSAVMLWAGVIPPRALWFASHEPLWRGLLPPLFGIWVAGSATLLAVGWLSLGRLRRRLVRDARPIDGERLPLAERILRRTGLRAAILVVDDAPLDSPFVFGWRRGSVVFPSAVLERVDERQFELLLLHELAHVRRRDFAANLLHSLLAATLFYCPAVLWIVRRLAAQREFCCDDAVLAEAGSPRDYVRTLFQLESSRRRRSPLAMASDGAPLLARIARMLRSQPASMRLCGREVAGALLVALTACAGIASAASLASAPSRASQYRAQLADACVASPRELAWAAAAGVVEREPVTYGCEGPPNPPEVLSHSAP